MRDIISDAHVQNYDKIFSTHICNGGIQVFFQESKNFTEVKTQYFRRAENVFDEINCELCIIIVV